MRLRIRRVGGIAGVKLHSDLDTTELPAGEAVEVERVVRARAGRAPSPPPHPDAFRYEITPLDEPGLGQLVLYEHEVPTELRRLVDAVSSSGEIEHPDQHEAE